MDEKIPVTIQHLISQAESYEKEGDVDKAFLKYEEIIESLLILNNEQEAKEIYKKISAFNSAHIQSLELKNRQRVFINIIEAEQHFDHGRFDDFIKLLEDTKKDHQSSLEVSLRLGTVYEQRGQKEKALENYLTVAKYYNEHRFLKKAHHFAQKAKSFNPHKLEVKILLAEIYIKEDLKDDARKELIDICKFLINKNELDEALKYVQKALQVDGVETLYLEGVIWFRKGLFEAAAQKFKLVNRLKSGHFGSLCYLGEIYINQNLKEQAFDVYQKAFTLRPWDSHVYHKLAEMHAQKEKPINETQIDEAPSSNNTPSTIEPEPVVNNLHPSLESIESQELPSPNQKVKDLEGLQTYFIESDLQIHKGTSSLTGIIALYEFVLDLDPTNEELHKKLQAMESLQMQKEEKNKGLSTDLITIEKDFNNEAWPLTTIEIAESKSLANQVLSLYCSFLEKNVNNETLNRVNKLKFLTQSYLDIKLGQK